MYEMFRKVISAQPHQHWPWKWLSGIQINAKEKVVGWYTTGTKFKAHDIEINEVFKKYTSTPVLVIIDVEHVVSAHLKTSEC